MGRSQEFLSSSAEEALRRRYGLPSSTNRDVLFRVLASLNAEGPSVSAHPALPAPPPPPPPRAARPPPSKPASRAATRTPSPTARADVREPDTSSSALADSQRRVADLQTSLAQRTAQLRATEAALVAREEAVSASWGVLEGTQGAGDASSASPLPLLQKNSSPSTAARPPVSSRSAYAQLLPRGRPDARTRLGGGVLSAAELFARPPPTAAQLRSPSPPFLASRNASSAGPAHPRAIAAMQARLVHATTKLAAVDSRRRAADEARAIADAAAAAARGNAAALQRQNERLREELAAALQEVDIREAECALLADLVNAYRAAAGDADDAQEEAAAHAGAEVDARVWSSVQR